MLSYQHGFHAGNLADVHKHALLAAMLSYMTAKPKPLTYIETHAGRGLYDLAGDQAQKTGEAATGILAHEAYFDADHPYLRALTATRTEHGETAYPGSPLVAAHLLRDTDSLHLAELHPQEVSHLRVAMRGRGAKIYQNDGLELAQSLCPPTPKRGLMLIDPPYDVKADYQTIPHDIINLVRKWNVGVIALWYPILGNGAHREMISALNAAGLTDKAKGEVIRHEVQFAPAKDNHKMIGSGMLMINAPWGTADECKRLDRFFKGLN